MLTGVAGRLFDEAFKGFRLTVALGRWGWGLRCRRTYGGGVTWPHPLEHDAQPYECDQRELVEGNRSDSENLSLEIPSSPVVPYGHGYASLIATGPLGTNATCSTSLYWHAGGTGGRLRGPGALVRGTGPHLTGTASQELAEFFTPSIKRSTAVATSTSPTRSASSWGATGSSGPYAYPDPCGRGR